MKFGQFYWGYLILDALANYFIFLLRRQVLGENGPEGKVIQRCILNILSLEPNFLNIIKKNVSLAKKIVSLP